MPKAAGHIFGSTIVDSAAPNSFNNLQPTSGGFNRATSRRPLPSGSRRSQRPARVVQRHLGRTTASEEADQALPTHSGSQTHEHARTEGDGLVPHLRDLVAALESTLLDHGFEPTEDAE